MSAADREPARTCVGCRARGRKSELVRLVADSEGGVRVDPTGRLPGRGAYVHPEPGCVEAAVRRGGLARALRTAAEADGAARLLMDVRAASSGRSGRSRGATTDENEGASRA